MSLTMSQATPIVPNGSELSRPPGAERIGLDGSLGRMVAIEAPLPESAAPGYGPANINHLCSLGPVVNYFEGCT
jgi:hypothetical protein